MKLRRATQRSRLYASHSKLPLLTFESLETRYCLSFGTTLVPDFVECCDVRFPRHIEPADMDGDGDLDVIAAFDYGSLAWFENVDGRGVFGRMHSIHQRILDPHNPIGRPHNIRRATAVDLDGDLDLDLVADTYDRRSVFWFENIDGSGTFFERETIGSFERSGVSSVADLDNDGDKDVIWSNSRSVVWFGNENGKARFGDPVSISNDATIYEPRFGDIDSDGDVDILTRSSRDGPIVWHENYDGRGHFDEQFIRVAEAGEIDLFDMDGDGDLDIILSDRVRHTEGWIENLGNGEFGDYSLAGIIPVDQRLAVGDIDNDGDADFLICRQSAIDGRCSWLDNAGERQFTQRLLERVIVPEFLDAWLVDMDGDLDLDIVMSAGGFNFGDIGLIVWHENLDGNGQFGLRQWVTTYISRAPEIAEIADLDGDGDSDVLMENGDHLVLYENQNGHLRPKRKIADFVGLSSIFDFDRDGDLDVLAVVKSPEWWILHGLVLEVDHPTIFSLEDGTAVWLENVDGLGTFAAMKILHSSANIRDFHPGDLDADGDTDLIALLENDDVVSFEQTSDGSFLIHQVITTVKKAPHFRFPKNTLSDIDGDGDLDLLLTHQYEDRIEWFANIAGPGAFSQATRITNTVNSPQGVSAADLDGDGDLDIVAVQHLGPISWFENLGNGETFLKHVIDVQSHDGSDRPAILDFDQDGDLDILSGTILYTSATKDEPRFNVRRDLRPESSPFVARYATSLPLTVSTSDEVSLLIIDATGQRLVALEPRIIGDSNGDGRFSSADLVTVFQAGEYEDSLHRNSTFAEGDWNGDGDFTTADFVFAFLTGNYDEDVVGVDATPKIIRENLINQRSRKSIFVS